MHAPQDPLGRLIERLPPGSVRVDAATRDERRLDLSALALLREVRGDPPPSPVAVVFASSTEEVSAVVTWAAEAATAVVPRGGGSGVSGGAVPPEGSVVLDLSRMDRVLAIDEYSGTVVTEAGVRGDRLEHVLGEHRLTTGHYPQSIAISTVGGWVAAASAGQASAGYGALEDILLGVTAVLADGRVLRLKATPRSAAGPDLRRLLIGSEGSFGIVTEAVLACRPLPQGWEWDTYGFGDFAQCIAAIRTLVRLDTGPAVVRAYDEVDAALAFGRLGHAGGCMAIVGYAADGPGLGQRRRAARDELTRIGATLGDAACGPHWWEHRNDAVGLYARIMGPDRAFGTGVIVDTLEIAALWTDLLHLYGSVREALARHAEAVGCHISHVYPSGSSLYFTFMIRGADDRDAGERYLAAWDDAMRSCLAAGGTITHHHGVGRLKAPYLHEELGAEGADVLRTIKRALDPDGILNPGALLPASTEGGPA